MDEEILADGGVLDAPQEEAAQPVHVFLQEGVWPPHLNEREMKKAASMYLEAPDRPEEAVDSGDPVLQIEYGDSNRYEYIGSTSNRAQFLDRFELLAEICGYNPEDIRYRID